MSRIKQIILHNGLLKLFALILAFFVWRAVSVVSDPVTTVTYRDIAVQMLNEELVTDAGKVYQVADNEHVVTVQITAKTSIQERIKRENIVATADFEEILLDGLVPVKVKVTGYEMSTQVEVSSLPNNIVVSIEDSTSKTFPIVPSAMGELDEIYALGKMTANPETITINGPESLVESIVRAEGQVTITGIVENTTIMGELVLYDANNLKIDQTLLTIGMSDELEIDVEILDTKMVPLELATSGEPQKGYEVASIKAEPLEMMVTGTAGELAVLDVIYIPGEAIDVTGKAGKLDLAVDITDYIPENISLYDANNSTIAVTVQIDKLGTKTIDVPVQSIVVENNPNHLDLTYDEVTTILVSFTGLDVYLESLITSDVVLKIDLKEYKAAGEYTVPVTISAIPGVHVIGEVEVPIVLTENRSRE